MTRFLFVLVLAGVVCSVGFGGIGASKLRCEYLVDPVGIDVERPRLSWVLESDIRGQRQTAYQILVAGSEAELAAGKGSLWDSGKVDGDETAHVVYAGKGPGSRQRCYWKVRCWDGEGDVGDWSEAAFWTMGLLGEGDWKGRWISFDTDGLNEDKEYMLPPSPYLRKGFEVEGEIVRATAYASALGLFEMSINGQRVGGDEFAPGWSNYNKRVYYLTYDVTGMLKSGGNAVGAVLSPGWYAGYVGFAVLCNYPTPRAIYGETAAFIGQIEIEYADGRRQVVCTDGSWKASTGAIRSSDILMGESYDAREELVGWDEGGFEDGGWGAVSVIDPNCGALEAYPGVTVQKTETVAARGISEPKAGVYVFDMGQNFAGRVRLKVRGAAGTKVTLRFAEMLHQDGAIMTENLRKARAIDTYILKGSDSAEVWEPKFTYHGFRYVEVTGLAERPGLDAVTGVVLGSATAVAGSFECSDPMINQLYRNITWTQRANFFEAPTDCPQRDERLGWTGDAQIYIRSACCNMDVASFFTKWLVALTDDQHSYGAFPDYAPWPYTHGKEYSPAWMDAGVICPYTIYKVYGDTRVIERHWAAMVKFMDFLQKNSKGYLRPADGNSWGDWLSVGGETPKDLIATIYFAYDARLMAEMAEAIGRKGEAKKYRGLFEKVRAAFNKKYVSKDGRIAGDTQTCYTLALYMDILPEKVRPAAEKRLLELIEGRNWQMATGFLGSKHLLPVLTKTGNSDVAYRLLTNKTYPSWGYSVVNGATTVWERWNSFTKDKGFGDAGMNSFSHYAFGAVCEWMFDSMVGIDTDGAGFERIVIRPQVPGSGFEYATGSYESMRGVVGCGWDLRGGRFKLDVTIPANTTATVYVPAETAGAVTEGGRGIDGSRYIKLLRMDEGAAVLEVQSGRYSFESDYGVGAALPKSVDDKDMRLRTEADPRVRAYVGPSRIVWQSDEEGAAVKNAEALLKSGSGQITLDSHNPCVLTNKGSQAGVLLDFGRELHGGVQIGVSGSKGNKPVKLRVRFGESVSEAMAEFGGEKNTTNDHAIRDQTTLAPWLGVTEIGNTGFRFVRIDLVDEDSFVKIKHARAVFIYRDLEYKGSFECDDERLNEIWRVGAYTVQLNMQDYLWDGIKRDRLVWIGDMHPETMTINSVFGFNEVVPKSLDLIRDETPVGKWMNGISSYSMWWVLIHHSQYMYHGDEAYLGQQRGYLVALLESLMGYIGEDGSEKLPPGRFLDWPSSGNDKAIHAGLHSLLIMTLEAGGELCDVLGEDEVGGRCLSAVEKLRGHRPEHGDSKQAAALMALAGLGDAGQLNRKVMAVDGAQRMSTFYGYYVLEARAKAGDYKGALECIRQYWGAMLDLGATTFWEDFDLQWMKDAGRIDEPVGAGKKDIHGDFGNYCYKGFRHSLCHGWASGPTAWLSEHVLGVQVLEAGCRKVRIAPHLGDLKWAEGTFPTPMGVIKVRHEKRLLGGVKSTIEAPKGIEIVR